MSTTIVSTARFVAEDVGVDKTIAALNKLAGQATQTGAATSAFSRSAAAALQQFAKARDEALKGAPMTAVMPDKGFARVQEQNARAVRVVAKEIEGVMARLDPAYKAAAQFAQEQSRLNALAEAGALSWQRHGELVSQAAVKYKQVGVGLTGASETIRLTSNQIGNLSYQLNDILSGLLMGQSPFMIMTQQGGQVVQALGDGPGGVKGSLSAIGSSIAGFASRIGPVGLAIGGVTAAAGALWYAFRDEVKPIKDLIDAQAQAVKDLAEAYNIASGSVEQFGRKSAVAAQADAAKAQEDSRKRQMSEARSVLRDIPVFEAYSQVGGFDQFDALVEVLKDFKTTVDANDPAFTTLNDQLATLRQNTDDQDIRRFADEIRATIAPNVDLGNAIDTTASIVDEFSRRAAAAKETLKGYREEMAGLLPDQTSAATDLNLLFRKTLGSIEESRMSPIAKNDAIRRTINEANAALAELGRPAIESLKAVQDTLNNLDLAPLDRQIAETTQEYSRRIEDYKLTTNDAAGLAALQAEREAALGIVRRQAANEAADEARAAAKAFAQATASRMAGIDRTIDGLQLEARTIGLSEGAAAALRFEFQALASAKQAVAAAGGVVSDAEIARIREAAGQISGLTDRLSALREANAAVDEFFPMEAASREAERLQGFLNDASLGLSDVQRQALSMRIDKGFLDAQDAADGLRDHGISAAQDIGQSFISNVGDVFADVFSQATRDGEDFFGSLIRGFAGLGSQLAAAGGKNLIGKLFGISDPNAASAAGIGGLIGGAGGSYGGLPSISPSAGVGLSFASSPPAIQALNRNMGGVGANVLKLAQSFDGLNERSSSQLLNGFLSKSGTTQLDAKTQAWCAAFANAALMENGVQGTGSNLASSFLGWGQGTNTPKPGDIVVLKPQARGTSGHVGFVAGFGDGTVQVFGGNQSDSARTSSYSTSQVAGYRTYDDQRVVAKGVSEGMTDYARRSGYEMSPEARAAMGAGFDGFSHNGATQGMTGAQRGLGALGAGIGIFSQGYQSGSPISGGVGGALGGFQAAQALGFAGPIGAIAGAGLGILGGILGGRAQRKAAHMEAAAKWEEVRPEYEAFDRSLSGEGVGALRDSIGAMWDKLNGFMQVGGAAWKYGKGNSSAGFDATGTKMFEKWQAEKDEFLDGFSYMLEDLTGGEGLEGAFAKGRSQVKVLDEQIKGFIDDVEIAFNSADIGIPTSGAYEVQAKEWEERRNAAVEQAKRAAGEYGLTMLYSSEKTTDFKKAVDSFIGTAAGLQPVLERLGWSAGEAAADISGRLTAALAEMDTSFLDGFARQINELSGKAYLNSATDLIAEQKQAMADAAYRGLDPTIVTDWFKLAAQDIVDGAELTGSAFDDLIKAFPELSGVVSAFVDATETAARTAQQIADDLKSSALSAYQEAESRLRNVYSRDRSEIEATIDRLKDFGQSIADFRNDLKLDDNLSPLNAKDRLAASRTELLDIAAKARGGDEDAQGKLLGVTQDYLDEAKAYYASSDQYYAAFNEVQTILDQTEISSKSQLSVAEKQLSTLDAQLKALGIVNDNLGTLADAIRDLNLAKATLDTNRNWGSDPAKTKGVDKDLRAAGLSYTGDYVNGQFANWARSQLPSTQKTIEAILRRYNDSLGIGLQLGGLVPGFATGGIVGNGLWNRDSVLARYAGGGSIALAGGEFVMPAPRVTPQTMPMLEGMRRGQMPGNDNGMRLEKVETLLRTLIATTGGGLQRVVETGAAGNRSAEQMALAARRGASNKQAA